MTKEKELPINYNVYISFEVADEDQLTQLRLDIMSALGSVDGIFSVDID